MAGLLLALALLRPTSAVAQQREPLCVPVDAHRIVAAPRTVDGNDLGDTSVRADPLVVRALPGSPSRFAIAVRDDLGALARDHHPGLVVVRLDGSLHPLGTPEVVRDHGAEPAHVHPFAGTDVADGVLLTQVVEGALEATVVSSEGHVPAPSVIVSAQELGGTAEWLTLAHRADGALALVGTSDGIVTAVRFDGHGARRGGPLRWSQRVGGPMQLLPIANGPMAALLARPVAGAGPNGEQARVQVLVALDEDARPTGEPRNTGLAQFPLAMAMQGSAVTVLQWVLTQGVAIASLPFGAHAVSVVLPRLFFAQPPLDGGDPVHAATVDSHGMLYDVAVYGEGAGLHVHLTWLPSSGNPVVRRDVVALRGTLLAQPAVVPGVEGAALVALIADETGVGLDVTRLRCDLVNVPTDGASP